MPPSVTVRDATPADQAALGRLGALLVAVHHDYDARRFIPVGPGTERGYGGFLASQLTASHALVLVAEEAGEVLGYVYAGVEDADWMALRGPAGVIYDLMVDPSRRGAGIGSALLRQALEALRGRGAPRVVLSTAHQNTGAQRLFAAAGFRPTMVEMTRDW
ncbi:MAG: GNAT family N-acetyltransferase [Phenylobacterium zucineum]|nr:MAG: GNAT family N-acetyltransferase [Phenylobacterium zucineum]